jgi:hypothetical protein
MNGEGQSGRFERGLKDEKVVAKNVEPTELERRIGSGKLNKGELML